ncbi:DNA replication origin-binding helicase [Felid alphaherpesvirus 1]|nr:DNA replication origin-binding helicase [Felid alphaherpesvirus 1]AVW81586.1 DNA replication origin-binding helicase [Felid alphaherpesvirus 1]
MPGSMMDSPQDLSNDDSPTRSTTDECYTSSVSLAKMLYGGDLGEWVTKTHPNVRLERQDGHPVIFPSPVSTTSRRVTIVRAPMGSGKTTALLKWLQTALDGSDLSALVISCRRSFTHTLAGRFNDACLEGFVTYFTSSTYIMTGDPFRRLLVQVESLHRVDDSLLNNYDILVLDEVMSTLGQLYSPTMTKLNRVDALLLKLLRTCPTIITMDATTNAPFVDFLATLRGGRNIHLIVNTYAAPGFSKREAVILRSLGVDMATAALGFIPIESREGVMEIDRSPLDERLARVGTFESFFGKLATCLMDGLNVCIFSSTVIFSELVARFCHQFTNAVLVLNSTRPTEEVGVWATTRVLVYTTVVTVGISFEHKYFHKMFAYIKPMKYGPDMVSVYQSLGRIRELLHNELIIYVDAFGARSEPIFTPMLLNHVIGMGWPSNFTQISNLLCCQFRDSCKKAYRTIRGLHLFSKFRYKHFFERCTLASVNDSINILHTLLEANCIRVHFDGCPAQLSTESFCKFLRNIHAEALSNQRVLRQIRETVNVAILPGSETYDTDEVAGFISKYLIITSPSGFMKTLLQRLSSPSIRNQFVNIAVLGACMRLPESLESVEVFTALYHHYASGIIPVINDTGMLLTETMTPNHNIEALWSLYKTCAYLTRQIDWDPNRGGSTSDLTPEVILQLLKPKYSICINSLLEVAKCHITPADLLAKQPISSVSAILKGKSCSGNIYPVSQLEHAVGTFKLLWGELFGAKLVKSTQTFPGISRVKNLHKTEIIALLESVNIDHSETKTYKQLYSLLMQHRKLFDTPRYKLRAPRWSRYICFLSTGEALSCTDELDSALACIPPDQWPSYQGALDFSRL